MKSNVLILADVFRKVKRAVKFSGVSPIENVSLPVYTWQCGLKETGKNHKIFETKIFFYQRKITPDGGNSSVMDDSSLNPVKKHFFNRMPQSPGVSDELNFTLQNNTFHRSQSDPTTLEEILETEEFVEAVMSSTEKIKEKPKTFN